jgi:exopolysaccharide biosynthesis predicted pyruvyltransferase EpsI
MPYPGNAGDSLIQFATARLLEDLGIRTTFDPRAADVILVPGGNPTMWPSIGVQRWQDIWRRYPGADFVVGPAGFRRGFGDWARAINERGQRVAALFARDPDSFDSLKSAGLRPDIRLSLSHDPALYLRESDWLHAQRKAAVEDYDLASFRDDREAQLAGGKLLQTLRTVLPGRLYRPLERQLAASAQRRNAALSGRMADRAVPLLERDVSRQRFEVFVEAIRAARVVHTDRLHVLLLAAMLGKKVFAYPTSHAKLEGVYRHSLAEWADVTLVAT